MAFSLSIADVDQLAYLRAGATLKFNTFDFGLMDPETVPAVGDTVVTTDPDWSGDITSIKKTTADRPGHLFLAITATNDDTADSITSAPFGLSDDPDGSSTYGYQPGSLSVQESHNNDGSDETKGSLTCYQSGLWPGQSVALTNADIGLTAATYIITDVTYTWVKDQPFFAVEFGRNSVGLGDTPGGTGGGGTDDDDPPSTTTITKYIRDVTGDADWVDADLNLTDDSNDPMTLGGGDAAMEVRASQAPDGSYSVDISGHLHFDSDTAFAGTGMVAMWVNGIQPPGTGNAFAPGDYVARDGVGSWTLYDGDDNAVSTGTVVTSSWDLNSRLSFFLADGGSLEVPAAGAWDGYTLVFSWRAHLVHE